MWVLLSFISRMNFIHQHIQDFNRWRNSGSYRKPGTEIPQARGKYCYPHDVIVSHRKFGIHCCCFHCDCLVHRILWNRSRCLPLPVMRFRKACVHKSPLDDRQYEATLVQRKGKTKGLRNLGINLERSS